VTTEPLARLVRTMRDALDTDARSDADLLARLRSVRDPAAAEAIVHRHGPRVLAACRRVLGPSAEAEDAFQATFLVLLRNPGAIRDRATLGPWLSGVAHRIAVRARERARRPPPRPAARPAPPDLSWKEACAILHEELDHLPDGYRLPLILCYLEGLSRDEAAARLGRSLNAVKKALEAGRARLRKRLGRRGVTLSAGLLAVVGSAPSADLPAVLVASAVQALATEPSSAAAITLARTATRLVVPVSGVLVACLAAIVVGFGATSASGPPPAEIPGKELPPTPPPAGRPADAEDPPPAAGATKPPPPADRPVPDSLVYQGRAVTLDGKPVRDAQVYLHINSMRPRPFTPRARTDADGRFTFEVKWADFGPAEYELSSVPQVNGHLIGSAPGLGVAWTRDLPRPSLAARGIIFPNTGDDAELLFVPDDVPVEGRVLNLEGKPVAGATIRTLWAFHPAGGNLDRWLAGLPLLAPQSGPWKALDGLEGVSKSNLLHLHLLKQHGFDPAVPTTRTGADGRFTVRGIGRERVAVLRVEGPGIETQIVSVTTRPRQPVTVPLFTCAVITGAPGLNVRQEETLHGSAPTVVVGPDRRVSGVVTDVDTGKPVAGAVIRSDHAAGGRMDNYLAQATTDTAGRFTLTGLPMSQWTALRVESPADQPYLPAVVSITPPPGLGPVQVNPKLKRGVWLTGRVFDRVSKAPVRVQFNYGAEPDNPHLPVAVQLAHEFFRYSRSNDGRFRTAVLPGRGYLAVWLDPPSDAAYERGQGALIDQADPIIRAKPGNFSAYDLHLLQRIDVAPDSTGVTVDLALKPGRSQTVFLHGPEGHELWGAIVTADLDGPRTEKLGRGGSLMVRPQQYVQVVCPDRKLAGRFLRLTDRFWEPLTLQPWAEVTGRVLTADGKPVPDAILTISGDAPGKDEPPGFWYKGEPVRTDKDGEYRIAGLIPGASYRVLVWAKGRPGQELRVRTDAKPGTVENLGDLKPEGR
jgi:RNA polymerase sigma factor (sigma-70 family)